jgi:hypothetical protein
MKGQLRQTTHRFGEILGRPAYEVAEPDPSGRRNKVFEAVLRLPCSTIEVAGLVD